MDAVLVKTFEIDKDVSLTSAASGIGNPLTVVGMTHTNEHAQGKNGIIHSDLTQLSEECSTRDFRLWAFLC